MFVTVLLQQLQEDVDYKRIVKYFLQKKTYTFIVNGPEENPFDQEVLPLQIQFGAEMLYVPGIVREGAAEVFFMQSDEPDNRSVPQLLLDCVSKVGCINYSLH